jgi:anionic cell wall polymer biosynthesis LytR-Cps2A-Psr (LCP) family protein
VYKRQQLGGIDVQVDRTFDDQFYPLDIGASDTCGKSEEELKALTATLSGEKLDQQFTCRYEQLHFDKGLQHLDGITALKYARSRHSLTDGGDFNRSEHQRQVLEAVKNKVVSLNFFNKIIPVFNTLSNHVVTDIDLNTMEKLLSRASEFSTYKINSLAITDKNYLKIGKSKDGQSILMPKLGENDFSEIQTFLQSN